MFESGFFCVSQGQSPIGELQECSLHFWYSITRTCVQMQVRSIEKEVEIKWNQPSFKLWKDANKGYIQD